ncbi:MAG: Slp family lipoprotein [Pseudomonadota bacterium]
MPLHPLPALLLLCLLLSACATGPEFITDGVETDLTPTQAASEAHLHQGKRVLWGGMIINSTNLETHTRLEVLAYPLDSSHRPRADQPPHGRFLMLQRGYLETVDYAAGRQITVLGRLDGTRTGKLDQSEYTYPLLRGEQLHLWPRQGRDSTNPRFHFGIGVRLGN